MVHLENGREGRSAPFTPEEIDEIRRRLLSAFDTGKRDLPWRGETDPYRIWVSEVMLQQTRVETVIPYYEKWLRRFPTLEALAEAGEEEVLRLWQGLGYYSRARRLHQGAQIVRERHEGVLPPNSEGLRELPGVGEYTAGAVASIAFGEAVPAVDGNVTRVLSRLLDLPNPSPSFLRTTARALVDPDRPGEFNQAMMELGSLICSPRSPRCHHCPLSSICLALARGTVEERPAPKVRKTIPEVDIAVVVAVAEIASGTPRFLLRRRGREGLLAGMWEFPGVEVERGPAKVADGNARRAASILARELGVGGSPSRLEGEPEITPLPLVTHLFSHLKARYRPFLFPAVPLSNPSGSNGAPPGSGGTPPGSGGAPSGSEVAPPESEEALRGSPNWVPEDKVAELPLPVAQQRIFKLTKKALEG